MIYCIRRGEAICYSVIRRRRRRRRAHVRSTSEDRAKKETSEQFSGGGLGGTIATIFPQAAACRVLALYYAAVAAAVNRGRTAGTRVFFNFFCNIFFSRSPPTPCVHLEGNTIICFALSTPSPHPPPSLLANQPMPPSANCFTREARTFPRTSLNSDAM